MVDSIDTSPVVVVIPQGATIQCFNVDHDHNIVLSLPDAALYSTHNTAYFGETIGRVANRIAGARIENLNGRAYNLSANDAGVNCLHGGHVGWGKRLFDGPHPTVRPDGTLWSLYRYLSPDGEEGFPGAVECKVYYSARTTKNNEGRGVTTLDIEHEVRMVGDAGEEIGVEETVIALTNHSYFNLAGSDAASIAKTKINLATNLHLPVDGRRIPTGQTAPFPGLEDRENATIELGPTQPAFDHCFVVNPEPEKISLDTRGLPLQRLITLTHPDTGINLEIESTEPAFQLYTGDGIDVPAVGGAPARGPRSGIAVEPGRYVNAVNEERWKGMVVLKRGSVWGSRSRYTAWRER